MRPALTILGVLCASGLSLCKKAPLADDPPSVIASATPPPDAAFDVDAGISPEFDLTLLAPEFRREWAGDPQRERPSSDPWRASARSRRGANGTHFVHTCPPNGRPGTAWGTMVYTDDSPICTAALHDGRITLAAGGAVTVYVHPGRNYYLGSENNGVLTRSFPAFGGSIAFVSELPEDVAAPEPARRPEPPSAGAGSADGGR
jgi:hypothetical protein